MDASLLQRACAAELHRCIAHRALLWVVLMSWRQLGRQRRHPATTTTTVGHPPDDDDDDSGDGAMDAGCYNKDPFGSELSQSVKDAYTW